MIVIPQSAGDYRFSIYISFIRLLSIVEYDTLSFISPTMAVDRPHHQNKKKCMKHCHFHALYNDTRPQNPASSTMHAYVGLYTIMKNVNLVTFLPFSFIIDFIFTGPLIISNICMYISIVSRIRLVLYI